MQDLRSVSNLAQVFPSEMMTDHRKIDLSEQEVKDMFLGIDNLLSDHVKILVGMRQQVIGWDFETSMISGVLYRYVSVLRNSEFTVIIRERSQYMLRLFREYSNS